MNLRHFIFAALVAVGATSFAQPLSGDYRHIRFVAATIAERPSMLGESGLSHSPAVIAKTKNRITFDLYFVPNQPDLPSFIDTRFNARRENHSWAEIQITQAADWNASDDLNKGMLEPLRLPEFRGLDVSRVALYPAGTITFTIFQESGTTSSGTPFDFMAIGFSISKAMAMAPQGEESAILTVEYAQVRPNQMSQTLRLAKIFTGTAQSLPMTEETQRKIERMLSLHACEKLITASAYKQKSN